MRKRSKIRGTFCARLQLFYNDSIIIYYKFREEYALRKATLHPTCIKHEVSIWSPRTHSYSVRGRRGRGHRTANRTGRGKRLDPRPNRCPGGGGVVKASRELLTQQRRINGQIKFKITCLTFSIMKFWYSNYNGSKINATNISNIIHFFHK